MRARLARRNPIVVLVAVNAILGALAVGLVLSWFDGVTDRAETAREDSTQAADLARIREQIGDVRVFVASETLRALRGDEGPVPEATLDAAVAAILTISETARAVDFAPLEGGEAGAAALGQLSADFLNYLNQRSPESRASLDASAEAADQRLTALDPQAAEGSAQRLDALIGALRQLEWGTAAIATVTIILFEVATWWVGSKLVRTVAALHARELDLVTANEHSERRNSQFRSLYYIVSEVMETLSIKYVVHTTVREARKLVDAEVVILRVLEDGRLRTRGVETAGGVSVSDVADDLDLGEGLAGRAAKRGRTMQLELPADACEYADSGEGAMRTGIVVPLIVGARVVGTISCWQPASGGFSADDVQVLEMMASQVASAIAAAELHEASERDAHHDPLTTLPNRRQLSLDVRYEFDAAVRRGREMAVAMLDIDHFKRFNDEYGHQAGDTALQRVAEVLLQQIRKKDQMYRYGGEEFVIVFDSLTLGQARDACERLVAAVGNAGMPGAPGARLTVSGGVVATPGPWADFDGLLRSADEALYAAKEAGRNRVVAFDEAAAPAPGLAA